MSLDIEEELLSAIRAAVGNNRLEVELEIPKDKKNGDLSSNIALRLASKLNQSPLELARDIQGKLEEGLSRLPLKNNLKGIEVKPPGFINFFLTDTCLYETILRIKREREHFGSSDLGQGKKVQIEFLSANPTGPLSIAHGRQAAVGDSLANLLEFLNFKVTREYYLNDEGRQIDLLGESILARLKELKKEDSEFPQDGYRGKYIYDIAKELQGSSKRKALSSNFLKDYGMRCILKLIKQDLRDFGVSFDVWYSQRRLLKKRKVKKALSLLEKKGFLYEKDGAIWLKSTAFSDDKDRVVVKQDKTLTYLSSDIAYHRDKYKKGFSWVINLWGPDHHGYIPRLKAALKALGYPDGFLTIIIIQLVSLYKEGKAIPMSTRKGEYLTLNELLKEVGADAARFFYLSRRASSRLDFNLDLAREHSSENPVYYVQYAHARISSIIRKMKLKHLQVKKVDLSNLNQEEELELMRSLRQFPYLLKTCFASLDTCSITFYLQDLASSFHRFYDRHRVLGVEDDLSQARLVLLDATRIVLANGLRLLGISAPEEM